MKEDKNTPQDKKIEEDIIEWLHGAYGMGLNKDTDAMNKLQKEAVNSILQSLAEIRKEGQKDILKIANDITEKPDRAVRYVPLDKLIEKWKSLSKDNE